MSRADMSIKGRVVIVTGSGQGIGRSLAQGLASEGAIPVIVDLNADRAEQTAREIRAEGGEALAFAADVSNEEAVVSMATAAREKLGRIDALINNAAIHTTIQRRPFYEIPTDEWRRVLSVNVDSCFICAKAVLPAMREAGYGRIVNMSSASVWLGLQNYLHYVASKAAIQGMTHSMARELGAMGITVNSILPGQVLTEVENPGQSEQIVKSIIDRQSVKRSATTRDLLGMMIYLISPASAMVTGQGLVIDGGMIHR